jgi:outer membrane protein insertion porin family
MDRGGISFVLLLAGWVLLTLCSPQCTAQVKDTVAVVEIKGLLTVTEDFLKTKLETQVGQPFSSRALKNDIQRLHALNFFSNIEVQVNQILAGVRVSFTVTENQLLGEIKLVGNLSIDTSEILGTLRIAKEKYLAPYALSLDVIHLTEMYHKKGFLFVEIKTETKPVSGWVDLYFLIDEGPRVYLSEINFFGNHAFSKSDFLGFAQSQETGLFSSYYYDEDTLQEDLILIRNFYRSEGYLDARVHLRDIMFGNDRCSIILNITVAEGRLYEVRKIAFSGQKLFSEEEMRHRLGLKEGMPFKRDDMYRDKNKLERLYGENGFLNIRISPIVSYPDVKMPVVQIVYKVEEGDTTNIRKIDVEGNVLTRDHVIRREFLQSPGEQFNLGKVENTQQRLRRLQYFETIKLDMRDTEDEKWKDISLKVEEGRTGSLRFAAGITSDLGAVGEISLTKRNFDISRFPASFSDLLSGDSLTGAGQTLDAYFQIGKDVIRFKLSFVDPYFLGYNLIFAPEFYKTERARESWNEGYTGMQVSFGRKLGLDTTVKLGYRLDNVEVTNVSDGAPPDVLDAEGDNVISSVNIDFTIDTRDDYILPTRGYTIGLNYELAGVVLRGHYDFSKANIRLALFQTIYTTESGGKHVLSFGTRIGMADPHGETRALPIFERFFAGGSTSIRGFRFRAISPKVNDDPVGGEFMFVSTVEYGIPIYQDMVRMVLFADCGNVVPQVDHTIFDAIRLAVGFGFRLKIPMLGPTPFAFDFGFPVRKEEDDDTQVFSFSLGKSF